MRASLPEIFCGRSEHAPAPSATPDFFDARAASTQTEAAASLPEMTR